MSACARYTEEGLRLFEKTPNEEKDYGFDYSNELEPGESLDTSSWEIVPGTGGTVQIDNEALDATKSRVDVSNGAVGDPRAKLRNLIMTTGGSMVRHLEKTFALDIVEEKGF